MAFIQFYSKAKYEIIHAKISHYEYLNGKSYLITRLFIKLPDMEAKKEKLNVILKGNFQYNLKDLSQEILTTPFIMNRYGEFEQLNNHLYRFSQEVEPKLEITFNVPIVQFKLNRIANDYFNLNISFEDCELTSNFVGIMFKLEKKSSIRRVKLIYGASQRIYEPMNYKIPNDYLNMPELFLVYHRDCKLNSV